MLVCFYNVCVCVCVCVCVTHPQGCVGVWDTPPGVCVWGGVGRTSVVDRSGRSTTDIQIPVWGVCGCVGVCVCVFCCLLHTHTPAPEGWDVVGFRKAAKLANFANSQNFVKLTKVCETRKIL